MAKTQSGVIDYAIYENSKEYLGTANIQLPTITNKVITIGGAGMAGDVDVPIPKKDPMHCTITFTDNGIGADKLSKEIVHLLDCRVVHDVYDSKEGKMKSGKVKYIMKCIPITQTEGTVTPASAQEGSVEMSVLSFKKYVDGKLVRHVDPINYIDIDHSGINRLDRVKKALGK